MTTRAGRVAILTIGTEITTGQIVDTNGAWLGQVLTDLRFDVTRRASAPDDEDEMRALIDECAARCGTLVLSGGLGPTSDDRTRDVVAAWAGQPLDFDEDSWRAVEERFQSFGMPTPPSNRQQCFFPRGATILTNRHGTAPAFRVEARETTIICLPGVPFELKGLWHDHLEAFFSARNAHLPAVRLLRWHTLGISESEVAERTERILEGSGLVTGYRPHFPYIEVKVWCPESKLTEHAARFARLEEEFAPWLAGRDDDDAARALVETLAKFPHVEVIDRSSGGRVSERLGPFLTERSACLAIRTLWGPFDLGEPRGVETLILELGALREDASWSIQTTFPNGKQETTELTSPYARRPKERQRLYQVEKSFLAWTTLLREKGNSVLQRGDVSGQ